MIERQDIIRMARGAGIPFNKWGLIGCDTCEQDIDDALERFAALVAAAEREACANLCAELATGMTSLAEWGALTCERVIRTGGQQ